MEIVPTFLRSVEVRYRGQRLSGQSLVKTFEHVMQEKHELEAAHKIIVQRGPNPILNRNTHKSSQPQSRNKEMIIKKIHHINCPVLPRKSQVMKSEIREKILEDNTIITDNSRLSISMAKIHMAKIDKNQNNCLECSEELLGKNRSTCSSTKMINFSCKNSSVVLRANLKNLDNKPNARSLSPQVKKFREILEGPLIKAQSKFSIKLKPSPRVNSSVPKKNTRCRAVCKSRQ